MSPNRGTYRVKIQQEAVDDLDRVYAFIAGEAPGRGKKFVRSLRKKILSLKTLPYRGTRVRIFEDDTDLSGMRFLVHHSYLIFYTVNNKEVVIHHVTGPGQNWLEFIV